MDDERPEPDLALKKAKEISEKKEATALLKKVLDMVETPNGTNQNE